ncbi:MAG: hypothetical protein R3C56_08330 [Pirellulaceae bacterium]
MNWGGYPQLLSTLLCGTRIFGGQLSPHAFLAAGMGLWQLRDDNSPVKSAETACESQQLAHHRTYIFAALMAYIAGILTLSRQFVVPTYLMLGLASAAFSHYTPAARACESEIVSSLRH